MKKTKQDPGLKSVLVNRLSLILPELKPKPPILVTGTHRSGTTVIGKLISADPDVRYIYEPMNPDVGTYMHNGKCSICGVEIKNYFQKITDKNATKYARHFKHLLNSKSLMNKTGLLKEPHAIFAAKWLEKKYGTKVIVLIRHPLSFVSSLKKMEWDIELDGIINQPDLLSNELKEFKKTITEHADRTKHDVIDRGAVLWNAIYDYVARQQQSQKSWLFIRLEDFQAEPQKTMEEIYRYLELEYTHSIKASVDELTNSKNPTESSRKIVHSIARNSKENVDIWKGRLTKDEIKRIKKVTDKTAAKFYPGD